ERSCFWATAPEQSSDQPQPVLEECSCPASASSSAGTSARSGREAGIRRWPGSNTVAPSRFYTPTPADIPSLCSPDSHTTGEAAPALWDSAVDSPAVAKARNVPARPPRVSAYPGYPGGSERPRSV